jgi:uncharacterized protein YceK
MRYFIAWLATALVTLTSGCGTVCNLVSEEPQVYGGVKRDLGVAAGAGHLPASSPSLGPSDGKGALVLLAFCGAELGASFVGDTLSLPWLLYQDNRDPRFDLFGEEPVDDPQFSCGTAWNAGDHPRLTAGFRCVWSETPWFIPTPAPTDAPATADTVLGKTAEEPWSQVRPLKGDLLNEWKNAAEPDVGTWPPLESARPGRHPGSAPDFVPLLYEPLK